jgi:hypothetical protein
VAAPAASLLRDGFACVDALLAPAECDACAAALAATDVAAVGTRNLLSVPWCANLAASLRRRLPPDLLPPAAVAVQCTVFAKSLARNWVVAWHQDLAIPVRARVAPPGWTCWSQKQGTLFVQPPDHVLRCLVAVRVHLDAVGPDHGPLRVLAGTHHRRLTDTELRAVPVDGAELVLAGGRGSAVVMRPLLVHASARTRATAPRRVLHFVFGPRALADGAEWHWNV